MILTVKEASLCYCPFLFERYCKTNHCMMWIWVETKKLMSQDGSFVTFIKDIEKAMYIELPYDKKTGRCGLCKCEPN